MIRDVGLFDWVRLIIAFLLFLGPGYAILFSLPAQLLNAYKRFSSIGVCFGFSIAFWAILFLWLKVFHLPINAQIAFSICGVGWIIALARLAWLLWKRTGEIVFVRPNRLDVFEAFAVVIYCALYIGVIQNLVVGMGSDSYHHTLIAQMFFDQGQIPDNYLPYAPIISFSYHYGFHDFLALLGWFSGWQLRLLLPVTGPLLVSFSGLAAAFLVGTVTRQRAAEPIVLIVVTFLSVFPGYMLNWGRYPQILGVLLMLVFLSFFFIWKEQNFSMPGIVWIGLLASGLSLTHYRMTILCAVGLVSYLFVELLFNKGFRKTIWQNLLPWGATALISILLIAPWVYFTYESHRQGVSGAFDLILNDQFYSLRRLGEDVLRYPSNLALIIVTLIASLIGLLKRERFVVWVILWWVVMYIISGPGILASNMDRVSFYITVYVPFGLLIGWLVAQCMEIERIRSLVKRSLTVVGGVALVWGMLLTLNVPKPGIAAFVRAEDMGTMEWIKSNTPKDAVFMVNTYAIPFSKEYFIGIDAGVWIPLLADRKTVIPPMNYQIERFENLDMVHNLVLLHNLNGQLATPEAVKLLSQLNIRYIYIGSKGGMINANELLASKDYKLEHQDKLNYVFRLVSK